MEWQSFIMKIHRALIYNDEHIEKQRRAVAAASTDEQKEASMLRAE
jgi:hypothetical protein